MMSEVAGAPAPNGGSVPTGCPVAHGFIPSDTGAHSDPFAWYQELRDTGRVVYQPMFDWYVVTRYEEVASVLKDAVTFSNAQSLGTDKPVPAAVRADLGEDWRMPFELFLTLNDPPKHTRLRKLMAPAFTPRRMNAYADLIREIAEARIDEFVARGSADLASDFAYRIPNKIIAKITGADDDVSDRFVEWTEAFLRMRITDESDEESVRSWRLMAEQDRYTRELVDDRRDHPANDLTTDLIAATSDDGEPALTDDEIIANIFGFFGAGSETSAIMIVNTMYLLLQHQEQWQEVRADPGLVPAAIEEGLRMRGPVRGLVRVAVKDTEIGGVSIPAGANVYICLAAANHDDEVFGQPERFDIHREKTADGHLAFGRWAHFCIGAPLARLEGRVAIEALINRLPNLRLAADQGALEYADNPVLPAVKALRVEWD